MPAKRKVADPDTAVTYVRVSTEEQAVSGLGLEAQRAAVAAECERKAWRIVGEFADEGISAKRMDNRPGLTAALEAVETGQAANLVALKVDRISRSSHLFGELLERARRRGWNVVVLDLGVDMSTPTGEAMAGVMANFAQLERRLIGQRTSDALQVLKRQGVRLGSPLRSPPETVRAIAAMRERGLTLAKIATALNEQKVPTGRGGGEWRPSSVKAVLDRSDLAELTGA